MQIFSLFILTFFLLATGCKSQQYTYGNLPQNQIVFGQGGGMAGGVKTYTLLDNGQLFVHNSITKESEELESMSPENAKGYFSRLDAMPFESIQFRHPGNRYYFLGRKSEAGEHRTVWGNGKDEVPPPIKDTYERLMAVVN